MPPQLHPYLFIIFFATIFEYNLHRLVTIIKNPEALSDEKHQWVKKSPALFYLLVGISVAGFLTSVAFAKKEVLITLLPIGILTLLYSVPVLKIKKIVFRLREIPLAKIFVISAVWAGATILLPIIQSGRNFELTHVLLMLAERFIFVFAITIPFDVRDMQADRASGLKTIPLLIGEKNAMYSAFGALLVFALVTTIHYSIRQDVFLVVAFLLSAASTYIFLKNERLKKFKHYHYFIVDGTMLLQAVLVCFLFYFK